MYYPKGMDPNQLPVKPVEQVEIAVFSEMLVPIREHHDR